MEVRLLHLPLIEWQVYAPFLWTLRDGIDVEALVCKCHRTPIPHHSISLPP